ncbi:DUF2905 domain-containing protein [Geovibrio thiophilus]|uniref:DUF2905 domain-containing protein n=1 Tax=Geovibrio thiophilus TaxID=139438 RepID=A0A3R5XWH4_9BACT|nr:DUF2905 domain-containing protein [Geovibrio thiophilus]QAR32846.1 DUF2905 domain-containing protein [Geovibrio thiophilus]
MGGMGKMLIIMGIVLVLAGVIFTAGERFGLGRLPGDIVFKGKNFSFHFPIVTSIIVSIVLTVVLNIFFRR